MFEYLELEKLHYQKIDTDKEFKSRFDNPCTLKTSLFIVPFFKGNKINEKEFELFYLPIQDILILQDKIIENSKKIINLSEQLPGVAKNSCITEIMLNEIIKSNQVEGVYSTKKELFESMTSKKIDRFTGIINKYLQIRDNKIQKIESVEEIRKIYDDIFSEDILLNPDNKLDGKLFRKNPVFINDGLKNIHTGDDTEEIIIKHLNDLILFMNNKNINFLVKACISHYYFEYIHPFYDGNGRFGRLLCSMYLARKLDIFTGLSFSYSVFLEKNKYSKLFSKTSHHKNYGEITFFIKGLLEIISKGQESILEMLKDKTLKLNYTRNFIKDLELDSDEKEILFFYAQNYIFSKSSPLKDKSLIELIKLSRPTLNKKITNLENKGYLRKISNKPVIHTITEKLDI